MYTHHPFAHDDAAGETHVEGQAEGGGGGRAHLAPDMLQLCNRNALVPSAPGKPAQRLTCRERSRRNMASSQQDAMSWKPPAVVDPSTDCLQQQQQQPKASQLMITTNRYMSWVCGNLQSTHLHRSGADVPSALPPHGGLLPHVPLCPSPLSKHTAHLLPSCWGRIMRTRNTRVSGAPRCAAATRSRSWPTRLSGCCGEKVKHTQRQQQGQQG
jgi:hypothetical protein